MPLRKVSMHPLVLDLTVNISIYTYIYILYTKSLQIHNKFRKFTTQAEDTCNKFVLGSFCDSCTLPSFCSSAERSLILRCHLFPLPVVVQHHNHGCLNSSLHFGCSWPKPRCVVAPLGLEILDAPDVTSVVVIKFLLTEESL